MLGTVGLQRYFRPAEHAQTYALIDPKPFL
jgi:hypothetical protein